MKCEHCPLRVDCLTITPDNCNITYVEDYDLEPHPSQVSFKLEGVDVDMIGSQLSLWVNERTFEALMKLRPQFVRVNATPDESQGYWDPGVNGPGLCIQVKRR